MSVAEGHAECPRDLEQRVHPFLRARKPARDGLAWSGIIFAYWTAGEYVPMDRWLALLEDHPGRTFGFPSRGSRPAALLGSLPVVLIYSFFVKYYVAGLTAGSVKG